MLAGFLFRDQILYVGLKSGGAVISYIGQKGCGIGASITISSCGETSSGKDWKKRRGRWRILGEGFEELL